MEPSKQNQEALDKLVEYGVAAGRALREVADVMDVPYLQAAAGISLLVMESAAQVRANKSQYMELMEQIHKILCVLVNFCGDLKSSPSLAMLHSISRFTETLRKIHAYIRAQADSGMFKRIIRPTEKFADCTAELKAALSSFGLQISLVASETVTQIHVDAAQRHEELMALVAQMDDAASSRVSISSRRDLHRSSSSLSLIPGSPKIFYGREPELNDTVAALTTSISVRIAILGPGGIGKTSLALAIMHEPRVVTAFGANRFFITLNAAYSSHDMIGKIAQYFGLAADGGPKAVLRHLGTIRAPILLVLDNMEDCWEPPSARPQVEDFLSHLTDVAELHLIVTIRGLERPGKTKWTRPFLPPLMPLSTDAARSTFLDITDEAFDPKLTDKVLALTDHLPLAISLIANLVSFEGCESVLEKWNSETTSLLSDGPDKLSNLDKSIMISISSARMTANPNALKVLSLLSLLPDGVTRTDLEQMNFPLPDLARSQSTLIRCALSYLDSDHRFKVLAPIRELVRQRFPPDVSLQRPLREHFYRLADLFKGPEYLSRPLVDKLSSDLGNLRTIGFTYLTTLGSVEGLDSLSEVIESLGEPQLQGKYLYIMGYFDHRNKLEPYSRQAIECFERAGDLAGQAKAYRALSFYYARKGDYVKTAEALSKSLDLATKSGDLAEQATVMIQLVQNYNRVGDLAAALRYSRDAHLTARASGNLWAEAGALRCRAHTCELIGDYSLGVRLCADGRAILSALALDIGNRVSVFRHIVNTEAEIALRQTNYTLARALNMSLTTPENTQTGFSHQETSEGYALINIAYIDIATGSHAKRRRFGLLACAITLGDLHCKLGEYDEARRLYAQSYASVNDMELRTMCIEKLSDVALVQQEITSAQRYSTLLLVLSSRSGHQAHIHHALRRLGDVFLAQGDETNALLVFEVALAGYTLMDIHRCRGECLLRIGDIQAARADTQRCMNSQSSVANCGLSITSRAVRTLALGNAHK
ncbi:hypothetical protein B0H14DRAFT_3864107 [Mycena olivaceomarginata]|nr:hypothetical protein B0H14DRAFT_3864107 [Mycena olivaceomarginata]